MDFFALMEPTLMTLVWVLLLNVYLAQLHNTALQVK